MKTAMFASGLALAISLVAEANDKVATWTGAVNSEWVNSGNWAEGVIPGRYLQKDGNGNSVVAGEKGWTAVFNRADARDSVTTGNGELISIGNIVISGENNTTAFGASSANAFPLEEGGVIHVESTTLKVPKIAGNVYGSGLTLTTPVLHIRNDSAAGDLEVRIAGVHKRDVDDFMNVVYSFEGTGSILMKGYFQQGTGYFTDMKLAQGEGGVLKIGSNAEGLRKVMVDSGLPRQTVEIQDGSVFWLGYKQAENNIASDLSISGPGCLRIGASTSNLQFNIGEGLTCNIASDIALENAGKTVQLSVSGNGDLHLPTANGLTGDCGIYNGAHVGVSLIGNKGAGGGLGSCQKIALNGNGSSISGRYAGICYTGSGEMTDRELYTEFHGEVVNAGAGDLIFRNLTTKSSNYYLGVSSETGHAVGFACNVSQKILARPGAKILLAQAQAVTAAYLITQGACEIRVADGTAASVSQLQRNDVSAILDVVLEGAGSLTLPGLSEGLAPTWLKVNGMVAKVDANGKVRSIASDDVKIDAHGGVVPNAPIDTVGIVTADGDPTKDVVLGADAVSVLALRQRVSTESATVVLDAGQTLSSDEITISDGAKPLVLSGPGGIDGSFVFTGSELVRSNADVGVVFSSVAGVKMSLDGILTDADPLGLAVAQGQVTMATVGTLPVTSICVANEGTLTVGGGTFVQPKDGEGEGIVVGRDSVGRLNFDSGAYTGLLTIAHGDSTAAGSCGDVCLNGGKMVVTSTGGELFAYGAARLQIAGGRYVCSDTARFGLGSQGTIDISSGILGFVPREVRACQLHIGGYNSDTAILVEGTGRFDASMLGSGWNVFMPGNGSRQAYRTQLTVENGGVADFGSQTISLGCIKVIDTHTEAVVNLNQGGTFRIGYLRRPVANVYPSEQNPGGNATDPGFTNHLNLVQFNGGVIRNTRGTPFLDKTGSNEDGYAPDRITVFEGGAVFDTSESDCTLGVGVALEAPFGKGVESIGLDDAVSAMTFGAPPAVRIIGDGTGASAVAVLNKATGKLSGIRVTGRGNGYTTARAEVYYGLHTTPVATLGTVVLTDNVSGGLTKRGGNVLTLGAVNGYTGPTVVESGTLKMLVDNAISSSSALVVKPGATLDLEGHGQSFSDADIANGAVVNGTIGLSGLTVDFNETLKGYVKNIDLDACTFGDGASLSVLNFDSSKLNPGVRRYKLLTYSGSPDKLPEMPVLDLPEGWSLSKTGGSVRIRLNTGLSIIFR